MLQTKTKQKRCGTCKKLFTPAHSFHKYCSYECVIKPLADKEQRKALSEAAERARRKENRQRLESLKPKSEWLREAQRAFNGYIRERDRYLPCISCSYTDPKHSRKWHAGHYRTTRAASQLRFNVYNVNRQCAQCNLHHSGRITEYRKNLIAKYGLERVESLEYNNQPAEYTIDYLKKVKRVFTKRAKQLRARREYIPW